MGFHEAASEGLEGKRAGSLQGGKEDRCEHTDRWLGMEDAGFEVQNGGALPACVSRVRNPRRAATQPRPGPVRSSCPR